MDLNATTVPLDNLLVAGRHRRGMCRGFVHCAAGQSSSSGGANVHTAPLENFLVAGVFCVLFVEQVEVTPTNKHRHRTQ